jgi:hypothetical protein
MTMKPPLDSEHVEQLRDVFERVGRLGRNDIRDLLETCEILLARPAPTKAITEAHEGSGG